MLRICDASKGDWTPGAVEKVQFECERLGIFDVRGLKRWMQCLDYWNCGTKIQFLGNPKILTRGG